MGTLDSKNILGARLMLYTTWTTLRVHFPHNGLQVQAVIVACSPTGEHILIHTWLKQRIVPRQWSGVFNLPRATPALWNFIEDVGGRLAAQKPRLLTRVLGSFFSWSCVAGTVTWPSESYTTASASQAYFEWGEALGEYIYLVIWNLIRMIGHGGRNGIGDSRPVSTQ